MGITFGTKKLLPVRRDKQVGTGTISPSSEGGITVGSSPSGLLPYTWDGTVFYIDGTIRTTSLIVDDLADGYVPYQKAADGKLHNSPIYTDGTFVSIGTGIISLDSPLHVGGRIRAGSIAIQSLNGNADFSIRTLDGLGYWDFATIQTTGLFTIYDAISGTNPVYIEKAAPTSSIFIKATTGFTGLGFTTPLSRLCINGGLHVGGESAAGDNNLLVDGTIKGETVESVTAFSSGFFGDGYKIIETGGVSTFEVDNLRVRGTLFAYELEINKISSVNGGLLISVANGTAYLVQDYPVTGGHKLYFDTKNGANPIQFKVGDYIKAQNWTGTSGEVITSYIAVVNSVTQGDGVLGNSFIYTATPTGTPWNGIELVQVGGSDAARQSLIYLTAHDTNNPYIAGYAGVTDGVFTGHEKFRLGNLTGITDAVFGDLTGIYGLWSDSVYLTGSINASSGEIGGWSIDTDAIYNGTKHTGDGYAASPGDLTLSADGSIHGKYFYLNANGTANIAGTELPHLVKKKASANVRNSNGDYKTTTSIYPTFVKLKSITVTNGLSGVMRVTFDMKSSNVLTTARAWLYKNDVQIGVMQEVVGTSYVTCSQDIDESPWLPGDEISIYGSVFESPGGFITTIGQFYLLYDDDPTVTVETTNWNA